MNILKLFILFAFSSINSLFAQSGEPSAVQAELISPNKSVKVGESFWVGLKLDHAPHWHTYWKTTATGYATSIDWKLPDGVTAGEIIWPAPQVYEFEGYVEYVYEGSIILPIKISVDESFKENELTLTGIADWLMCEKVCIPGTKELSLNLPITETLPDKDSRLEAQFQHLLEEKVPALPESLTLAAWQEGAEITLKVTRVSSDTELYFFDSLSLITPELKQPQEVKKDHTLLNLKINPAGIEQSDSLEGVLVAKNGGNLEDSHQAIVVDIPLQKKIPREANSSEENSLAFIMGIAFIGGLILNLMPCVFPVLGIKIMGFVGQAGESKAKVALHGVVFSLGVLISFWSLAILLLALRSGGEELGWGFQLQSPAFVYLLTLFLFLFALNLTGLFEVGQSAVGVGSNLTAKSGWSGSFFSGVLATVVATPCAAPFLAPALGVALTLSPLPSLIVFTSIGLGLSAPYLILSLFPALIKFLPKPGAWMESFKQLMSFPLFATVGYLLWVLAGQLTEEYGFSSYQLLYVLLSIVLLAAAGWIYGRWGAFHRKKGQRIFATGSALVILLLGISLGYPQNNLEEGETPISWEKWEPGKAQKLAEEGKIVYVDFTARWCVTCQTNKAAVFSSQKIKDFIEENGVVLLKADWTNRDSEITTKLAEYNRSAVPFNLIYSPSLNSPQILPEILTPQTVLGALQNAKP